MGEFGTEWVEYQTAKIIRDLIDQEAMQAIKDFLPKLPLNARNAFLEIDRCHQILAQFHHHLRDFLYARKTAGEVWRVDGSKFFITFNGQDICGLNNIHFQGCIGQNDGRNIAFGVFVNYNVRYPNEAGPSRVLRQIGLMV